MASILIDSFTLQKVAQENAVEQELLTHSIKNVVMIRLLDSMESANEVLEYLDSMKSEIFELCI